MISRWREIDGLGSSQHDSSIRGVTWAAMAHVLIGALLCAALLVVEVHELLVRRRLPAAIADPPPCDASAKPTAVGGERPVLTNFGALNLVP